VLLTVRVQAHQVGLDSFVFSSTTDVTYTPHLQDPHSEQKQQIEVFSHSVSPLFQPEWCFCWLQVLEWRSFCIGRLPSNHLDPSRWSYRSCVHREGQLDPSGDSDI